MSKEIVKALADIQKDRKLSERQLAKILGLHHSTLQQLKSGQRNPGRKVLSAIASHFPELNGLIMDFITK